MFGKLPFYRDIYLLSFSCNDIFDANNSNSDAGINSMSIAAFRTQKPRIPLPFHPRSAGGNNFRNAGRHVDLAVCSDESFRRLTALYADLIARLPGNASENDPEKRLFARCLHLIRTRYNDPTFNVDTLAEMMQMHRTTLLRLFRRKQNTTPREYLTRYRIGQSLYLLETTLLPVAEIAGSSGFNRCNYFCQVIRHFCGKTPEQYRKEKMKGRSAAQSTRDHEAGTGRKRS